MPACNRETDGWLSSSSQVGSRPISTPSATIVTGSTCKSSRMMMKVASMPWLRVLSRPKIICHLSFDIGHLLIGTYIDHVVIEDFKLANDKSQMTNDK